MGKSILSRWENNFRKRWVSRLPPWIETWHLTYMTLAWSAGILLASWKARQDLNWMWFVSLMVIAQYLTDLFDGAVGRYRHTGLIKWGYYMDHLLDYFFQCAIVVGYMWIAPEGLTWYFVGMLIISSAYMVSSFLSFAATNEFEIYFFGIGPTEIRILVILLNTSIILLGTGKWPITVPIFFWTMLAGLFVLILKTHRKLWRLDMQAKQD
jgi:archaetidylinositol phosphate synthase